MEITRLAPALGVLGILLALTGLGLYHLFPSQAWTWTLAEILALLCLSIFFVLYWDQVKAFSARRSTRFGFHSILVIVLMLGILLIINFLAARHPLRWDFSETRRFTLAPQTYQVLRHLDREVTITIFAHDRSPGFPVYRDLMTSYTQVTPMVAFRFVDPEQQPSLARRYSIKRLDTAVIESGSNRTQISLPTEAALTGALIRVSHDSKKQILFLQGHGEPDLSNHERDGLTQFRDKLEIQGYEVRAISLNQEQGVPSDTSVLVIADPRDPLTPDNVRHLNAYVKEGGRVLILAGPRSNPRLSDVTSQWGVSFGSGVVADERDRLPRGGPTALFTKTFTEHEITHDVKFQVLLPDSRAITFDQITGADWEFSPLAHTSPRSWEEKHFEKSNAPTFDEKEERKGPFILAAALQIKEPPQSQGTHPAIVVVGNSAFASNAYFSFPGNTDFLLHSLAWLVGERQLISITPKDPALRPFIPNPTQERTILVLQVFLLPGLILLVGFFVWKKRRSL